MSDINSDDFTVGLQVGAGVNLKKWRFDLRFDQSISERTLEFTSGADKYKVNNNRSQLILLSVGYELF